MTTASLSSVPPMRAQWQSIGNVTSIKPIESGIELDANPAAVRITVLAPDVIRVRMSHTGAFAPDSSWAVVNAKSGPDDFTQEPPGANSQPSGARTVIRTALLRIVVNMNPCRIEFYDRNDTLLNRDAPAKGMSWSGDEVAVWKSMPRDEFCYGFGEKAGMLSRKGTAMSMWNSDVPAYHADTDPLYQTIPFFYGIRNGITYGIFMDNTYFSHFDMGKEHPEEYSFGAVGGELNYYFIYGPTPAGVNGKFTGLIGRMPLPPRWAIGYQQCRYSYFPESRVREIASNFRAKKIPCDVIYLDIHYMDGYRCFTWDKQRFPDPGKLAGDLAKDGFKIVTIIDPGIKNEKGYWVYDQGSAGDHFVKYPGGKPFTGKVWPGECVFPDFTRKQTREWWGSLYKGLLDLGIKGFWNDMNEPSVFDSPTKTFDLNVVHDDGGLNTDHRKNHNVYGMQMARGTYEGVEKLRPGERPFVLTRANYAGGNRYAAAWTGDNISSWEHLEMAVPMCLNLSISGQPFVGTDIGGFVGSPSGELYARWLQLGTFLPLMRTHTEFGSADQEPWSYGQEFEAINKRSIELRYKLLPYLYTQFYKASMDGTPIIRPIFFDYPSDRNIYWHDREFLFGDALLVAPVLWPGQTKRDVRLPEGMWYDYWSDSLYEGSSYSRVDAPLDRIPIFVKAGSIIPTQQLVQYTDQEPVKTLTLDVYPGPAEISTILYEDDGKSFAYKSGNYSLRKILHTGSGIELSAPEGSYKPAGRSVMVRVAGAIRAPGSVALGGKKLAYLTAAEFMGPAGAGWSYDPDGKTVMVKFEDTFSAQRVSFGN